MSWEVTASLLEREKGCLFSRRRPTDGESHLGVRVSYAIVDRRTQTLYACLDHGHWGCKLQRSRDRGKNWEEIPAPKYLDGSMLKDDRPAVLRYQWCLTPRPAIQPGRLYMGTEPGGLFVSDDEGDSFRLVESLWNHPSRKEQWMGGGLDEPGIHSVLIDPRDPNRISVGISVAGVSQAQTVAKHGSLAIVA